MADDAFWGEDDVSAGQSASTTGLTMITLDRVVLGFTCRIIMMMTMHNRMFRIRRVFAKRHRARRADL